MSNLSRWAGNLFTWAGKEISSLWAKAGPIAQDTFSTFIHTFEAAAIEAVTAQELNSLITGDQKRANVADALLAKVESAGWKASAAAMNTLIEDALASVRASQGAALVTPPGS